MLENPILIHAQRFKGAAFGDKRLQKRGLHYTRQFVNISPLWERGWGEGLLSLST